MRYTWCMLLNFKSKETEKIWKGEVSLRLPRDIQNIARRKLRMLNNARKLNDLRIPPNNRLEALKGNRAGEHSIRINDQWRICFKWVDGNVADVIIEDYH
jgi:proteic killer suppression protein